MRRFLLPVLALAGLGLSQENYSTNWTGHRTLHVNTSTNSSTGTALTGNVLKYPMLVRLSAKDSAVFAASKANGADVRFTKSNNTARLKHQIDMWDSAGRKAAVWVLMDTVYAGSLTQTFRMHWGNSGAADSSSGTAVFDSANGFHAVWHMGNASGATPRPNAVAGGKPATPAGNATAGLLPVAGAIGMADSLRSAVSNVSEADHFTLDSGYVFPQGSGTISMWVNMSTQPGTWNNFIALSAGTAVGGGLNQGGLTNNVWFGRQDNTNNFRFGNSYTWSDSISGGQAPNRDIPNGLLPYGEWHQFTVAFDGPLGGNRKLYKNGTLMGDFPLSETDTLSRIKPVVRGLTFLGRSAWGDRNFRGKMDEVRVSYVARSADWVKLDYASQNPAASLVSDSVAPSISYAQDSVVTTLGFGAITIPAPMLSGVPHPTVTISPALPAGLSLNNTNPNRGMISGTPTAAITKTKFIITASNTIGGVTNTTTDSIWITVNAPAVTEDYATWTGTKTVSFNSPTSGTVSSFPLLVRLTSADAAVFNAGRASLRFSKPNGAKLNYSIDSWDSAGQSAAVWVLMDNVAPGANSVRMHWGKTGAASQADPSTVFSRNAGFVTVHHLGNAPDTTARPNSVDTANAALPIGFPTGYQAPKGLIGMADSLTIANGTTKANGGDYLSFGTLDSTLFTAGGTASISIWAKPTTAQGNFVQYYTMGNTVSNAGSAAMWIGKSGTNSVTAQNITAGSNVGAVTAAANTISAGAWQHLAFTVQGSNHRLYRNGALLAFSNSGPLLGRTIRTANYIGAATWPDPVFNGVLDEARLANVERSADWLALEYATQQPGAAPTTLAYPAVVNARPNMAMTTVTPTVTGAPANFSVSGTVPAGLTFNDTTGAFSGTPTVAGDYALTVTANAGAWSTSSPVMFSIADADGAYATAWSGHKFMNVNTNGVVSPSTARLTKFPMLVRLGAADSAIFTASQNNGADIRFTKLNNTTRLQHQIDSWDKANKRAAVWVLLDTVYGSSSGSRFMMHYGNATAGDSSKPAAVFDSARYAAVFHLGGDRTTARPNAVPGANPATPANLQAGYTASNGIIGMADSLGVLGTGADGSHLSFGPMPVGTVKDGKVSYSAWIKKNPFTGWRHAISIGSGSPGDNFWFGHPGDNGGAGALRVRTAEGATEQTAVNVPGFWTDNAWQLVHVSFDGSVVNVYGNGVQAGNGDIGHILPDVARTSAYIGRALWNPDNKFLGVFDEVRVVKSAVSPAWAKLEYENQKPTGSTVVTMTDSSVQVVVGVNAANAFMASAPTLGFKRFGQGLMFQVQSDVASKVRLSIIDMHGRTVWNHTAATSAGMNQISWNGSSNNGQEIGSGVFAVRMSLIDENGKVAASLVRRVPITR